MSYPFGGHPTLKRFIEYAKEHGCDVQVSVRSTCSGRAYEAVVINNPNGGQLTVPNPDYDERLTTSVISNYQRRLALKTPFAAMPEAPEQSE